MPKVPRGVIIRHSYHSKDHIGKLDTLFIMLKYLKVFAPGAEPVCEHLGVARPRYLFSQEVAKVVERLVSPHSESRRQGSGDPEGAAQLRITSFEPNRRTAQCNASLPFVYSRKTRATSILSL